MEKSAVVFGGSGFIGSHLLNYLKKNRYKRIVSVDLLPPRKSLDGVEYIIGDVRNSVNGCVDGDFEEVYNLAAVHTTPGHADHEYYDTNVFGAINIVRFCNLHSVKILYFTSSISVYGSGEVPKTEESTLAPVSAYGKSKLQAENIYNLWAQSNKRRRLFVARLGVIFGPGENGNFTRLAKALSTGFFFYPGRRDTIKGCAYVEEVLRTFRFVLKRPEPIYIYNITYPQPYTIEQICNTFREVGGLPLPKGKIPTTLMMTAAFPFEIMDRLGFHNPICRARVHKLANSTFIIPHRLLNDGYIFETDLREGLKRWRETDPKGQFV